MNRFSLGLHVPGNVAIACKRCNNEKRRDDQHMPLSEKAWESFLSHDGTRCAPACKTCRYWESLWSDPVARINALAQSRDRVHRFQVPFLPFVDWSMQARRTLKDRIEVLYRDCQSFATNEITRLANGLTLDFWEYVPQSQGS
jgi:hypothetical protein